jgi:hypothetical protein
VFHIFQPLYCTSFRLKVNHERTKVLVTRQKYPIPYCLFLNGQYLSICNGRDSQVVGEPKVVAGNDKGFHGFLLAALLNPRALGGGTLEIALDVPLPLKAKVRSLNRDRYHIDPWVVFGGRQILIGELSPAGSLSLHQMLLEISQVLIGALKNLHDIECWLNVPRGYDFEQEGD